MKTYSGGMFARLAFAISVIQKPEILLVDEGIGAGDAGFHKIFIERLNDLYKSAKILILASHSTDIIKTYCNKVIEFKQGCIVSESTI